jgi:gas vesicle protein GvpL/GvpF
VSEATVSSRPTALYVYGVVQAGTELDLQLVEEGDLAAICGEVPLAEFGEEPLRSNLEDRAWLERTAREHEQVLDRALGTGTVIPFRIATLYESEEGLHEFLRERHDDLAQLLERLDGKVELGVKAYLDNARQGAVEEESGASYLRRRQAEEAAAREADAFAIGCAQTSHERLSAVALDARANRAQSPELSGRSDRMLLNGAYLVPRGETSLESAVQELRSRYGERGVTYEVTGPWPPYNFVPRDLAGA